MDKIIVDTEKCTMCGLCMPICPMDILEEGPETARTSEPDNCYYCGHCRSVCPEDALHFPALPDESFVPVLSAEELQRPDRLLLRFRSRRTTRHFRPDEVEREKIEKIILAGQYAPTGNNRQGVQYLVVQSPEALDKLRKQAIDALSDLGNEAEKLNETAGEKQASPDERQALSRYTHVFNKKVEAAQSGQDLLFYNAPVLIFCHADPTITLFTSWDVSLASMQMLLMAEALELGTCFNGALIRAMEYSSELRAAIPIPAEHEIPVCFMVGYPALDFLRTVYRQPAKVTWV